MFATPRRWHSPILEIQARKVELLSFPLRNFAVLIYTSRYFNYPIGSLTEYYKFDTEDIKIVLSDLQQMLPSVLSKVEIDILEENTNCEQIAV